MPTIPQNIDFDKGFVFVVDKPLGWTSFDVVNKLRIQLRLLSHRKIKVGHAGTLDPLATGVLIVCVGAATKGIDQIMAQNKTYTGTVDLGFNTPSYDLETQANAHFDTNHITDTDIIATAKTFVGLIEQYPPIFSAIKVDGKAMYKSARQGETVDIKPRSVTIDALEIYDVAVPKFSFKVNCSKGTYIRSLAFDMGQKLNTGGTLTALCRTKSGDYSIEDAWNLNDLVASLKALVEAKVLN